MINILRGIVGILSIIMGLGSIVFRKNIEEKKFLFLESGKLSDSKSLLFWGVVAIIIGVIIIINTIYY